MKTQTLIVALNKKQGRFIANELRLHPSEYHIFSGGFSAPVGYRFKVIIFYGPWFQSKGAEYLEQYAMSRAEEGCVVIGRHQP